MAADFKENVCLENLTILAKMLQTPIYQPLQLTVKVIHFMSEIIREPR